TQFNIETPPLLNAHETALYLLDEFDITDDLRINVGLRLSTFAHVGPFTLFDLDEEGRAIGKEEYSVGKTIASYAALEPRISTRYRLNGKSSIKASYNRGQQYVHLAS